MDKITLYQLPKDILIELVCKNFDNYTIEEITNILKKKCEKVIKNTTYTYLVDGHCIFCREGEISITNNKNEKELLLIIGSDTRIKFKGGRNYFIIEKEENLNVATNSIFTDEERETALDVIKKYYRKYKERELAKNMYNRICDLK